ncbi:MAG: hypothetical protein AABZ06_12800 [Bdellovibrionota bacterium]
MKKLFLLMLFSPLFALSAVADDGSSQTSIGEKKVSQTPPASIRCESRAAKRLSNTDEPQDAAKSVKSGVAR